MVKVPWAGARSRFTLLFECWAIEVLTASRSISEGCGLLGLDWSSGQRIMKQGVERGLERRSLEGIERIGMDEKSFGRGQDYISVMNDLDEGRVLEVRPGRDVQSGCELWRSLPQEQRSQVKAVAIDMSAGFEAAARQEAPQAQIVYDKFHVSKSLNEAVDKVRREEHRRLSKEGDERLKGSRQLWLYNPLNLDEERMEGFQKLLEENLKTSRAWVVKENFSGFWDQEGTWQGEQYFRAWHGHAMRTRLDPIKKVARSLRKHLAGLLNYFTHRISNAMSESLNSRIQSLKANARGFRTFENYRIRILFFLGKLDLKPAL
jgi:transposase